MTPSEIMEEAGRVGLGAICITDHDSVEGLAEAAAVSAGVEFVPGVEINADNEAREIHIVGYFIDPLCEKLRETLMGLRRARLDRAKRIVDKLRDLGVPVTIERVVQIAGNGAVGRPHIAQAICETGAVSGMNSAFGKYLTRGARAYVPRGRITPQEAIEIIIEAGGVAGLAHPGKVGNDGVIEELLDCGLGALEVHHTDHGHQDVSRYSKLAAKYNLIATGGSDSHGMLKDKPISIGSVTVGLEVVGELRAASQRS